MKKLAEFFFFSYSSFHLVGKVGKFQTYNAFCYYEVHPRWQDGGNI